MLATRQAVTGAEEPIDLEEAKTQVRAIQDVDDEDDLIEQIIDCIISCHNMLCAFCVAVYKCIDRFCQLLARFLDHLWNMSGKLLQILKMHPLYQLCDITALISDPADIRYYLQ